MKKIMSTLFAVCFSIVSLSQNTSLKLVKLLDTQKIEQAVSMVQDFNFEKKQDSVVLTSELEKKIATEYAKIFTETELKELINFYKSKTGKNFLKNKNLLFSKVNSIVSSWEMKKQGFEEPKIEEVAIENLEKTNSKEEEGIVKQKPKIKINTLKELKDYLAKNPEKIYDSFILSELLDIKTEELNLPKN